MQTKEMLEDLLLKLKRQLRKAGDSSSSLVILVEVCRRIGETLSLDFSSVDLMSEQFKQLGQALDSSPSHEPHN